jgi:hypothetical protein
LPVDTEPLEGGREAAACLGQPVLADGPGGHGGLLVDDQVRVGGAGPAAAAVLQPGQEQAPGQVIERAGPARDDQPPAAEVDVAEVKLPDGLGPGGVHGGQRDRDVIDLQAARLNDAALVACDRFATLDPPIAY